MPNSKQKKQQQEVVEQSAATMVIPAQPGEGQTFEIYDRKRGPSQPLPPVEVPNNAPAIQITDDEGEETGTVARFDEAPDLLSVAISFEIPNVPKFSIKLINMHWGLMEDIEDIQNTPEEQQNTGLITGFFHEYVEGGPRAVPIGHTRTVFNCIKAYMQYKSDTSLKN